MGSSKILFAILRFDLCHCGLLNCTVVLISFERDTSCTNANLMDARDEKAAARSRWKKNQSYNHAKHKFRKKGITSDNEKHRGDTRVAAVGQQGAVGLQEGEKRLSFQPRQSTLDKDDHDEEEQGGDYEEWLTLYPAEPVAVLTRKRLALPDSDVLQFLGQEDASSGLKNKEILDTHINLNELEKAIGPIPLVHALDIGSDLQQIMFGDVMHHPAHAPKCHDRDGVLTPQLGHYDADKEHIATVIEKSETVVETGVSIDKEMESILHIDETKRGQSAVDGILMQSQQTGPSPAHLEADDQELDDFLDSLA